MSATAVPATRTETFVLPRPPVAAPALAMRPEIATLRALVERVHQSATLPATVRLEIIRWKEKFDSFNFDLQTEGGREGASLTLCILLCQIIRPLYRQDNGDIIEEALGFDDAIVELMGQTVPSGESVEAFIAQFEELENQRKLVDETIGSLRASFEKEVRALYSQANVLGERIVETFTLWKARLTELQAKQTASQAAAKQEIAALHVKIDQVINKIRQNAQATTAVAGAVAQQQSLFKKVLHDCLTCGC